MHRILTAFQKELLGTVGRSDLSRYFVWSGGTALSFYYLRHRRSYDLDFLSQDFLPDEYLLLQIRLIARQLRIQKIEEQKRFNRHEFWFRRGKEVLRIEFVFYPFPSIKKPLRLKDFGIRIDSIEDILTNKTHAVFERAEPKDVFDLYCIVRERKIKFLQALKWVKKKFGVNIDPVLLTSKIFEGIENLIKIKPIVIRQKFYDPKGIKDFFEKEAHNYLKKKIKI